MAKPKKTKAGNWHIQIEVRGQRLSGTFATKREAEEWSARRKTEVLAQAGDSRAPTIGELRTLADALRRYAEEVSPTKDGWAKELVRINAFLRRDVLPVSKPIARVTTADMAAWRDARSREVKPGTVLRDISILDNVFEVARRDWQWIKLNPMRDMRKPPEPKHRDRLISGPEIRRMLRALQWSRRAPVRSVSQAVAWAFVLALQTGMRAGEICALRWDEVLDGYIDVGRDKVNKEAGREVPMVPTTSRTLQAMRGWDAERPFGMKTQSLDAMFRKYRGVAGLEGFTFHDARHTAATRLAHRLHILALCKMFGWTDPKRAMTYYNPTGKSLTALLMQPYTTSGGLPAGAAGASPSV